MPTQKIDPKVIFASNAPAIDNPPVFSDKTKGWDVARANDGRPEIKQMNKVQQDTDLKILWLNENSVTPYDESIDYPDGAVALKDGSFKQLVSGAWVEFLDGFANKDEVKRGIANRYDSSLTYNLGERVVLTNGDIVKSTVDGNINDPNVDMTGWVKLGNIITVDSIAEMLTIPNPQTGMMVTTKSYHANLNKGGKSYIYDATKSTINDGGLVINGWICVKYDYITPEMFGAKGYGDDADALLRWLNSGEPDIQLTAGVSYYTSKPLPIPETVRRIRGNFAEITYDREQTTALESSLLQAHHRSSPITIERVSLKYTGTFDYGYSYHGRVSGIDINTLSGCSGVTIREVTASGFNWAGIAVGRFGSFSNPNSYIKNVLIENCYSHHNRVSGIWFGWVDGILLTGNRLEFNGMSGDIGTGYGCSGASDAYPKNATVIANFANYNFRKGIDFHAGFNIIITDNHCVSNFMYGIALPIRNNGNGEFPLQPLGSLIVARNIVSDMLSENPFPIEVYFSGTEYTPESYNWSTTIDIVDNIVSNCKATVGNNNSCIQAAISGWANVTLNIRGNSFEVGDVTYLISLTAAPLPPHPAHTSRVDISHNRLKAERVNSGFMRTIAVDTATNLIMQDNFIEIADFPAPDGAGASSLIFRLKAVDFSGNRVVLGNRTYFATNMVEPALTGSVSCRAERNTFNGISYPDLNLYVRRHISEDVPSNNEAWRKGSKVDAASSNGTRGSPLGWVVPSFGYAVSRAWTANTYYAKGARIYSGVDTYYATVAGTSGTVAITRAGVDGTVTWALLGPKAVFTPIYNAGPPA